MVSPGVFSKNNQQFRGNQNSYTIIPKRVIHKKSMLLIWYSKCSAYVDNTYKVTKLHSMIIKSVAHKHVEFYKCLPQTVRNYMKM